MDRIIAIDVIDDFSSAGSTVAMTVESVDLNASIRIQFEVPLTAREIYSSSFGKVFNTLTSVSFHMQWRQIDGTTRKTSKTGK